MHPILISLGSFKLYTYGFFIALGFLAGVTLARTEARRMGASPEKFTDLCFYMLIAAILGSRVFYAATAPRVFLDDPLEFFKIWKGGLVFYGAFFAALLTLVIYVKKKAMPFWRTADILAPPLAAGHALGRIGCFFAGCCYGKTCELPWAVTFSHPESLAPVGVALHPTQLYSSLNNFIIFAALWSWRKRKTFDGQLFWLYVLMYGITRSVIEAFRGDFRGGTLFDVLTVSQTIGVSMSVLAAVMLIILGKRRPATDRKK